MVQMIGTERMDDAATEANRASPNKRKGGGVVQYLRNVPFKQGPCSNSVAKQQPGTSEGCQDEMRVTCKLGYVKPKVTRQRSLSRAPM